LAAISSAPVPMVTSCIVEYARSAVGVKFIVSPDQLSVPATEGSMEKASSTDVVFIDSLNVMVIKVVTGMLVPVGVLSVMVGGFVSTVLNVHM